MVALSEDCGRGAAYGVPVALDRGLLGQEQVWFEGGDHRTAVRVAGADLDRLMRGARLGAFSHPV